MSKDSEVNWDYIVSIDEFQSNLNSNSLKEVSMVSKLMREKLKPLLFKKIYLRSGIEKSDPSFISIVNYSRYIDKMYGHKHKDLRGETGGSIDDSVNDFVAVLNGIKKYAKRLYYSLNGNDGYYLYPLINLFDRLTELSICFSKIPFKEFADIGKTLPNLNKLELVEVYLVKLTTDIISEKDIIFPRNLSYLYIASIQVITIALSSDYYEYLPYNYYPIYYKCFTLPKVPMLTLKSLYNISFDKLDHGLEEFLDSNSDVESSHTREYKLNLTSSLNSLKDLCIDDNISFDIIDQDYRPNSINSLTFISFSIGYSENFMKLCQLCSNLVYLKLMFYDTPNFSIIDKYLASDLTKLQHLKTLVLVDACNCLGEKFLDFTKFAQIENLKVDISFKSLLNIKFENCKSLKRVEFIGCDDTFDYEFESKFNQYKNWVFKFGDHIIKGYKI